MNSPQARNGRILIVDDERATTAIVAPALRLTGYQVLVVHNAQACFTAVPKFRPDLLVLEVELPDQDGFRVAQELRAAGRQVPVMFVTAKAAVDDRVRGLRLGADDFLPKPVNLEEFVLRVGVILRRFTFHWAEEGSVLRYADLELDESTHEVRRAGRALHLPPTEFRLLHYLLVNAGKVVSKAQIFEQVWQYPFSGNNQIVESYIHLLRRKIDTVDPKLVQTVRGFGYALRASKTGP